MAWYQGCKELTKSAFIIPWSFSRINDASCQGDRFVGALSVVKARAPVTGGNFGVWGGMFSTFDCAVKGFRQKEDMWNAIISGFLTGGCLAARSKCFLYYRASFLLLPAVHPKPCHLSLCETRC